MISKRINYFQSIPIRGISIRGIPIRINSIITIFLLVSLILSPAILNSQDKFGPVNLIENGDFEQGNVGFTSGLTYVPDVDADVKEIFDAWTYSISTSSSRVNFMLPDCKDHTSATGLYMIINPALEPDIPVWSVKFNNIVPNTTYNFSFWYQSTHRDSTAELAVRFNNSVIGDTIFLSQKVCKWEEFTYTWESGNSDTLEIVVTDYNIALIGNDFGLDDFELYGECKLDLTPMPDINICSGTDITLNINAFSGVLPYDYEWFPKTGLSDYYSPSPIASVASDISYSVRITDGYGCEVYDTLNITVTEVPEFEIVSDLGTTVCQCENITLTALPGYDYLWSDGSDGQAIVVSDSGKYSVFIYNGNGCSSYDEIQIDYYDTETEVRPVSTAGKTGDTIRIPFEIVSQNNPGNCDLGGYRANIRFNNTILTPTGGTAGGTVEGDYQTIEIEGSASDNFFAELEFISTFGNAECTDIIIEEFDWDCTGTTIIRDTGRFCLLDICKSAGIRLFSDNGKLFLKTARPNPAADMSIIEFGIIEEASSNLYMINSLGERVMDILTDFQQAGQYSLNIDLTGLARGLYFYVLETPTAILTSKMVVAK